MSDETLRRSVPDVEVLVALSANGDRAAMDDLSRYIRTHVARSIFSRSFPVRIRRSSDAAALVAEVLRRVMAHDFRRLRLFLEIKDSYPRLRLASWLRVVAKRAALDSIQRQGE